MTTMHLPSTLVKCLYLFFDLPNDDDITIGKPDPSSKKLHANVTNDTAMSSLFVQSDSPYKERKLLLQKIFVQVCEILFDSA